MRQGLELLKTSGRMDETGGVIAPFAERQRLVQEPFFDDLEAKYATR
jgi:hypothetical protein